MGSGNDYPILLGRRLLSAATREGEFAPGRPTCLSLQAHRHLYRCWQTRTPYDESTHINALERRGSPLLTSIGGTAKNYLTDNLRA